MGLGARERVLRRDGEEIGSRPGGGGGGGRREAHQKEREHDGAYRATHPAQGSALGALYALRLSSAAVSSGGT
jgi:hypothetical protein